MIVKNYDLSLDVDFKALSYKGTVRLSLQEAGSDITLNSVGLEIHRASAGGKNVTWEKGTDEEELIFHGLPPGNTTLEIAFSGKVAEQMLAGFYKSRFNGDYILTTQFESTQARRMIPCIDHPGYKAVFNLDITVAEDLKVLFNTEEKEVTRLGDGRKRVVFHPTPRMSTYLLYFGIGHFHEVERTSGKLRVIVALPEEMKHSAGFALDHGAPIVEFFERYFGIPYPLPKLHLISIPDTWVGAMENWGAITFREIALLVDADSSASLRRWVAMVMAHEIAHQWFGDLVTMAWWNDLWLNESFATFMSFQAVDHLHPEWKVWNDFLAEDVSRAFLWDALVTSHPIEANVVRPVDIDEAFDEISYEKGGAVLKMIEAYLGREEFRKGVSAYLKRFEYGNASSQDLWRALEEVTGVPVPKIMGAWIQRIGYPLVTVKQEGGRVLLEQDRFLLHGKVPSEPWPLPIEMTVNGKEIRFLMEGRSHSVDIGAGDPKLTVNTGRTGYYRINYVGDLRTRMVRGIHTLPEIDRWGLVQDTYAFLLGDRTGMREYLDIVRECATDTSNLVATEIVSEIGVLLPVLEGLDSVKAELLHFAKIQLERVGLKPAVGESETLKGLRERLALLRVFLDRPFASEMGAMFSRYDSVDPELKTAVVTAAALTGGKPEHEKIAKTFLGASTETEAVRMTVALASFKQEELLKESLGLVFHKDTGLGRAITLVSSLISIAPRSTVGRDVMWPWMQENIDKLLEVTHGSAIFSQFMQGYVSKGGIGRAKAMRRYMGSKPMPGGESGKAKGLELLNVYERLYRKLREAPP